MYKSFVHLAQGHIGSHIMRMESGRSLFCLGWLGHDFASLSLPAARLSRGALESLVCTGD